MKEYFSILIFFTVGVFGFAQIQDEWLIPNPDYMGFFQDEMTSLARFQEMRREAGKEPVIPLYLVMNNRWQSIDDYSPTGGYDSTVGNIMANAQIKINNSFYIPIFGTLVGRGRSGKTDSEKLKTTILTSAGQPFDEYSVNDTQIAIFAGSGLVFNTDLLRGGIFAGYSQTTNTSRLSASYDRKPIPRTNKWTDQEFFEQEDEWINHSFKIALLPLVETSSWYGVGKVLNNILGYVGMGDSVEVYTGEDNDSSTIGYIVDALNYALDFTFNRIDVDFMTLNTNMFYKRGNYDAEAKNETYGLAVNSIFSFPFQLGIEGGYKRFYSVHKDFTAIYPDTGYINIDLSIATRILTFGINYYYDAIYKSVFSFTISTTSGFLTFRTLVGSNDTNNVIAGQKVATQSKTFGGGIRYRHGMWR
jgi:hypothetical protein